MAKKASKGLRPRDGSPVPAYRIAGVEQIDGPVGPRDENWKLYETLVIGGVKREAHPYPHPGIESFRVAREAFRENLLRHVGGNRLIVWRIRPHWCRMPGGLWQVRARLTVYANLMAYRVSVRVGIGGRVLSVERVKGGYVVRPDGALGTCGFSPYPWEAVLVRARGEIDAVRKAWPKVEAQRLAVRA